MRKMNRQVLRIALVVCAMGGILAAGCGGKQAVCEPDKPAPVSANAPGAAPAQTAAPQSGGVMEYTPIVRDCVWKFQILNAKEEPAFFGWAALDSPTEVRVYLETDAGGECMSRVKGTLQVVKSGTGPAVKSLGKPVVLERSARAFYFSARLPEPVKPPVTVLMNFDIEDFGPASASVELTEVLKTQDDR